MPPRMIVIPAEPVEAGDLVLVGSEDTGPLAAVVPMTVFVLLTWCGQKMLDADDLPADFDDAHADAIVRCCQTVAAYQADELGKPIPTVPGWPNETTTDATGPKP